MKNKSEFLNKENVKNLTLDNARCARWFMIPYLRDDTHSSLYIDYMISDREYLVFYLEEMYLDYAKKNGLNVDDCSFLNSGSMDSICSCPICSRIHKMFMKKHTLIKCKHCGKNYWMTKRNLKKNSETYKKNFGKHNPLHYCHFCSFRLNILIGKEM